MKLGPAMQRALFQLRGERRLLLVLIVLLATVLVVLLVPKGTAPPAEPAARFVFAREPDIRIRVASIDPGASLTILDVRERLASGGRLVVSNRDGEAVIDQMPCPTPILLTPARESGLRIGDRSFGGDILIVADPQARKLHAVNRVALELYLEGVVLSEMPADSEDEALYAQTVASRSYAAWQLLVRRSRLWDVTDTQRSQVYRGTPARLRLARRVVTSTRGLGLLHDGRVVEAVFSSTCGGATRSAQEAFGDASVPPLRGVSCGLCNGTQFSTWKSRVKRSDAGRALDLGGAVTALDGAVQYPSGRLESIIVRGPAGERKLGGNQFRDLFGATCRSTWFTRLDIEGEHLVAEGRGFGHGAGMCQVGAQRLAAARQDHRAILAHYYPGASISLLYAIDES